MNEEFPFYFLLGLKPEEAIAYLKSKKYKFTWDWHEMLGEAHNSAFTVAKVMKQDILEDIKLALQDAQDRGLTLQQFRRQLEPILKAKGWWGRVPVDQVPTDSPTPLSLPRRGDGGEVVRLPSGAEVQLGSPWRLRTIYNTNIRSAYMSGKYKRFLANAGNRPYWQYIAVMDAATRPSHARLHGKVFRYDDPFWDMFTPPIDWGCRCNIRAYDHEDLMEKNLPVEKSEGNITTEERLVSKKTGVTTTTSVYKDPITGEKAGTGIGWNSNPGAAWQLDVRTYEKALQMPENIRSAFIGGLRASCNRGGRRG